MFDVELNWFGGPMHMLFSCSFEKEFLFCTLFTGTRQENYLFELQNFQF